MYRLNSMSRFDDRIPETRFIGRCESCGEGIQEGHEHYELDGEMVHDDPLCITEEFEQEGRYTA